MTESAIILQFVVLVTVEAEDEEGALGVGLGVRVERCLIWYTIFLCDINGKLDLGDESLLVPQPDY